MPFLLMKQVSAPIHEQIIGFLLMILLSGYFTGGLPRMRCCNFALARTQTHHFPPREVGYVTIWFTKSPGRGIWEANGAGLSFTWRRSTGLLVQVWFFEMHLRHPKPRNHVLRCRSLPYFHTRANPDEYLRPKQRTPAPGRGHVAMKPRPRLHLSRPPGPFLRKCGN